MAAITQPRRYAAAFVTVMANFAGAAPAAVPVDIVKTDLRPLIRAGAIAGTVCGSSAAHCVDTKGWNLVESRWARDLALLSQGPRAVPLSFHVPKPSCPRSPSSSCAAQREPEGTELALDPATDWATK